MAKGLVLQVCLLDVPHAHRTKGSPGLDDEAKQLASGRVTQERPDCLGQKFGLATMHGSRGSRDGRDGLTCSDLTDKPPTTR